eukprot:819257-Rhodomonas_salina.1
MSAAHRGLLAVLRNPPIPARFFSKASSYGRTLFELFEIAAGDRYAYVVPGTRVPAAPQAWGQGRREGMMVRLLCALSPLGY